MPCAANAGLLDPNPQMLTVLMTCMKNVLAYLQYVFMKMSVYSGNVA